MNSLTKLLILLLFCSCQKEDITPRRYFYPSLNKLPYLDFYNPCPISENIAQRALSLPLYYDLTLEDVELIVSIINKNL